jgi:hypothetical protein
MKLRYYVVGILLASAAFAQSINQPSFSASSGTAAAPKVTVKTAPPPSATLTCTPPSSGVTPTGYNFYRSTVTGGPYTLQTTMPATACNWTDNTVAFSTTYYYVATALNGSSESAYSNQATAVIPVNPVPNPPQNLTVTSVVAGQVPLQWQAPIAQPNVTVESYTLWRGTKPTLPSPSKIASGLTATQYTDSGCPKKCYYEVTAEDLVSGKQVQSAPSNIVEAVTKATSHWWQRL